MHVANLTAIFCKARQEPLECKRRGMSRCATLSLRQAKPLHSSAKWDCAVCQKRSHSFFGHTGWHKFTRKTSTLRSTPFVQRYFFLLKGQARIKGIFITYEWFDLSFFRRAMVRSIGTAAVCEVTGDGELKSIFQALRPPFSFTPSLHLSLYVNHSFLSEAPSRAIFKHIELCTFSLFPSLHSSPDLASPPSPFSQLITFHSLFLLLISPFQPFASFFQPLFAFWLRLSSRLPFSLALCNWRWSY